MKGWIFNWCQHSSIAPSSGQEHISVSLILFNTSLRIVFDGSEDAIAYSCAKHENVASRIVPFKLEYAKRRNAAARIAPFKIKCAEHMFPKGSIHHLYYNEDAFTCIQDRNNICTNLFGGHHSNPSGENFDSRSHA